MRLALISDVHGNLIAFDAVLADIAEMDVDQIVCLGDTALSGPQPGQALERLMGLHCPVIMGNADQFILEPIYPETTDPVTLNRQAIQRWCVEQSQPYLEFIRTFLPTYQVDLGDGIDLLCFHASPRSNEEYIGAITPLEELKETIDGATQTLLAGGHTHNQLMRRFGVQWLINPGSVGMTFCRTRTGQRSMPPPWAEYAIATQENGRLSVDLRAVPFDVISVQRAAYESGMPAADWYASCWESEKGFS